MLYIIRKRTTTSKADKYSTKYFMDSDKDDFSIFFSSDINEAKKYDSFDGAQNDLRKIFHRTQFHINIQYDIVKIAN